MFIETTALKSQGIFFSVKPLLVETKDYIKQHNDIHQIEQYNRELQQYGCHTKPLSILHHGHHIYLFHCHFMIYLNKHHFLATAIYGELENPNSYRNIVGEPHIYVSHHRSCKKHQLQIHVLGILCMPYKLHYDKVLIKIIWSNFLEWGSLHKISPMGKLNVPWMLEMGIISPDKCVGRNIFDKLSHHHGISLSSMNTPKTTISQ